MTGKSKININPILIAFLRRKQKLDRQFDDPTQLKLLEQIFLSQNQMTVGQLMNPLENPIASPATIHRKLNGLRDKGFIADEFRDGNRRTKYMIPTEKAALYFSEVADLICDSK